MSKWTAKDIPDQTGKTAIITGGNSGIGYSAARELLRNGCKVILACRDVAKAERAKTRLSGLIPNAQVSVGKLDLSSLASVKTFAGEFLSQGQPLDLLINNAGIMAPPKRQTTADGFELQFGTNHLGHFALTGLLLPALLAARAARIVTVSSIAHRGSRIDFNDLQSANKYNPMKAYGQSKLANLLFGFDLERRLGRSGASAISIVVHPGIAKTNLFAAGFGASKSIQGMIMENVINVFAQSSDQGALPTLLAATDPGAQAGKYYGPGWVGEFRGNPRLAKAQANALDTNVAKKLWDVSEKLTGVTYPELNAER